MTAQSLQITLKLLFKKKDFLSLILPHHPCNVVPLKKCIAQRFAVSNTAGESTYTTSIYLAKVSEIFQKLVTKL